MFCVQVYVGTFIVNPLSGSIHMFEHNFHLIYKLSLVLPVTLTINDVDCKC